jgi:hypothetical protein
LLVAGSLLLGCGGDVVEDRHDDVAADDGGEEVLAKNQLGHTSKTVTVRHYIDRRLVVPDYRAAIERPAPGSGASHGTGPAK